MILHHSMPDIAIKSFVKHIILYKNIFFYPCIYFDYMVITQNFNSCISLIITNLSLEQAVYSS